MEHYDRKVQVLYAAQRGCCAFSGQPLNAGWFDLNHAGMPKPRRGRAAKRARAAFPNLMDSILNLNLVDKDAHMTRGQKRWPAHVAVALERRLARDPRLSEWMNMRVEHDLRETIELREYLLRDTGAIDTSYRDRIIALALSKRGAA